MPSTAVNRPSEGPFKVVDGLALPHLAITDMEAAYREMASDEARESEASAWSEGLVGDVVDERR